MNHYHINRIIFSLCFVLSLGLLPMWAQQATVKGTVIDNATGEPVFGAMLKTGNYSVYSDEKGLFELKLNSPNDVVIIECEGYARREIALRGRTQLSIELFSDDFRAISKDIENLTGKAPFSHQVAGLKDVAMEANNIVSVDELFQAKLGGDARSISRSGVAGAGAATFIRGLNSLYANAQPLYVVDGIIWNGLEDLESVFEGYQSNALANINVNDIKNVTVLKDGTSMYGARGSNGVVLINTYRGESAVTKIDLNIMESLSERPSTLPMLGADDYRVYLSDMYHSAGYSASQIAEMDFFVEDPSKASVYNKYHNQTNWAEEAYRNGFTHGYSIGVNGGDEKALYYFSLGYVGNQGVVKTTSMDRINTRFNADIKMASRLDFALGIGFAHTNRYLYNEGMNKYSSPTYMAMAKAPFLSPYAFTAAGQKAKDYDDADVFNIGNPLTFYQYASDKNKHRQYRFNVSGKPQWHITDQLTLSSAFDYSLNKFMESYFVPMAGTAPEYLERYFDYSLNTQKTQSMRNIALYDDTRLTYQNRIGSDWSVKAMLGWRYQTNSYETDYAESHNSGTDNNVAVGNYKFTSTDGINDITHTVSTYANVELSWKDRYFLNGVVSVDGSSRFGKKTEKGLHLFGYSFGVFPSLNAAWLISSESFMKDLDAIDLLKLRVGYDVTGNDDIEDYAARAYFVTKRYIMQANGAVLKNLENESLQWETTRRAHAGIDVAAFNERVSFSYDLFKARTSDLLTLKTLNNVAGVDAYWSNEGELTNTGSEFSFDVRLVNRRNFRWSLGASIGHYQNRITRLPVAGYLTSVYGADILTQVGQAAGVFYGYKQQGVIATEEEAAHLSSVHGVASPLALVDETGKYTYFTAGDIRFEETLVDGILDENDKQIIGDPNPDFYGNLNTTIGFGRFTLNTLFTYSYGNDVYNYLRRNLESASDFANQTTASLSRWKAEGQQTSFPKAVYGDPMGNARFSDRWIEDGSYLRLKTISLSYEIPMNKMFIKGLNIWVSANNLWTLTNYLGMDPESSISNAVLCQGIDAGITPQTRSYCVGLKINL